MRTTTKESLWLFREGVLDCIQGVRYYQVEGSIVITLRPLTKTVPAALAEFRKLIIDADKKHPWSGDRIHPEDRPFESIRYLSEGKILDSDGHFIEDNFANRWFTMYCWFKIFPGSEYLRQSQLYAYERYLKGIIEEIAEGRPSEISEVRYVIEINGAPQGIKIK